MASVSITWEGGGAFRPEHQESWLGLFRPWPRAALSSGAPSCCGPLTVQLIDLERTPCKALLCAAKHRPSARSKAAAVGKVTTLKRRRRFGMSAAPGLHYIFEIKDGVGFCA